MNWESLRADISAENLNRHLSWFSKVRRDTGGPGEEAAAAYIAGEMAKLGIPCTVHEFDAFLSYPREAKLEVVSPESTHAFTCITHSFALGTPSEGVVLDLVVRAHGDLEGVAGKAVLQDGLCEPGPVYHYSKAGAGALIFANRDRMIHNMIATTIWGTPTPDQLDRMPFLPVVSVSREDGEVLKALLAQGSVSVRVTTRVDTGWYRSQLPEVHIQGGADPDLFVLAGAHYCAWDVGITDNATGDTLLLEMARLLWERRSQLRHSVRLCWWPGHSHGRYSGSTWYADTFFERISQGCIAHHNIDSPGTRGATWYVLRHTTADIEEFSRGLLREVTGQDDIPVHRPARSADQSFFANGVSAMSCYPWLPEGHPDKRPWTGGCGGAWWWHTPADDTLDKASVEILAQDTYLSAKFVAELCTRTVLPLDPGGTARQIREHLHDLHRQAGAHLPAVGDILAKAQEFEEAARALMDLSRQIDDKGVAVLNRVLLEVARILHPVLYSEGGRFAHDPADLIPPQGNRPRNVFPGLGPAFELAARAGTREYGFYRTQAIRELNRIATALGEASTACRAVAFERNP